MFTLIFGNCRFSQSERNNVEFHDLQRARTFSTSSFGSYSGRHSQHGKTGATKSQYRNSFTSPSNRQPVINETVESDSGKPIPQGLSLAWSVFSEIIK